MDKSLLAVLAMAVITHLGHLATKWLDTRAKTLPYAAQFGQIIDAGERVADKAIDAAASEVSAELKK